MGSLHVPPHTVRAPVHSSLPAKDGDLHPTLGADLGLGHIRATQQAMRHSMMDTMPVHPETPSNREGHAPALPAAEGSGSGGGLG